jgi:PTH1 family peptidyl-tRNA hydrolase
VAQVVVGLGNPGPDYQDTRHNVGQRVLDLLARDLRAGAWRREKTAMVARGRWRGANVYLVKPLSFMNVSGPAVAAVLRHLGADPAEVILVHDDIDMALGAVRTRLRGGHGGHNGVRSVIEALGTEEIRRVKVGIGRPAHKGQVPDHVLAPFDADEQPAVEAAVARARDRVLALLSSSAA